MKVYVASDHAGFVLKQTLIPYLTDLGYEVEDCGAHTFDEADDYPDFIRAAAEKLSLDAMNELDSRAIILGASGQGEAMTANRFSHVRAALYYGEPPEPQTDAGGSVLDMISSVRHHNDANALSLGGRFLSEETAKAAVSRFLQTTFSGEPRHARRIKKIDA